MDARGTDRPAVVVLADACDVVSAIVLVLAEQGYDVHLPLHLVPEPAQHRGHPRLHPVPVERGAASGELVEAVQRSGSPLALVVCSADDDLLARSRLVRDLRRSLRHSGVLVVGTPGSADRPPQVAGVRVAWLTPGRALPFTRLLGHRGGVTAAATRTARRGLDAFLDGRTVVTCSPALLHARDPARAGPRRPPAASGPRRTARARVWDA